MHSLGGYLGLRFAATRTCAGWIGLDGPFGLAYPWKQDAPGLPEPALQIAREIHAIHVASDFAAVSCPAMLMLCATAANSLEEPMVTARRELAEHIARCHSEIRIEWIQMGHDTIIFLGAKEVAAAIRGLLSPRMPRSAEQDGAG